jgi:HK97 family phage prohead protease
MADIERRATVTEIRAAGRKLAGYAAVFNTPADIGGNFTEIVRPSAFRATLAARSDVLALVDHDPSKLLGRTASGTLRLGEDSRGLSFELDVPATQLGNDLLLMCERGDLGGCSIGVRVAAGGEFWPDKRTRELRSVQLAEISIIHSWPAYPHTSVSARNRGGAGITLSPAARRRLVETL